MSTPVRVHLRIHGIQAACRSYLLEPAHLWDGNYPAGIRELQRPGFRRAFA